MAERSRARIRMGTNVLDMVLACGAQQKETGMKIRTIALAAAFALSGTVALAQAGSTTAGGNPQAGIKTKNAKEGDHTKNGAQTKKGISGAASQSGMPSSKDASTQGANTAGAVDKKGDANSPGTMKK
jgi:hypothetical protein